MVFKQLSECIEWDHINPGLHVAYAEDVSSVVPTVERDVLKYISNVMLAEGVHTSRGRSGLPGPAAVTTIRAL
jgi:hypothetical protein